MLDKNGPRLHTIGIQDGMAFYLVSITAITDISSEFRGDLFKDGSALALGN